MTKTLKIAAILILCVFSVVSYSIGYNIGYHNNDSKNYQVASRMSDLIRCYEDHLREDSIQDWGCFEELEGTFLWDDAVGEPIDLKDYVWCY